MKNIKVTLNIGGPFEGVRISQYLDWDKCHLQNFYWNVESYLKTAMCDAQWTEKTKDDDRYWRQFLWVLHIYCINDSDDQQFSAYDIAPDFLGHLEDVLKAEDKRLEN